MSYSEKRPYRGVIESAIATDSLTDLASDIWKKAGRNCQCHVIPVEAGAANWGSIVEHVYVIAISTELDVNVFRL